MPITKNYNRNFFKSWSRDMAYVLGFLYADGNIVKTKRGTHYISWYIADKDLLYDIRTTVKSEHLIKLRSSSTGKVYRLQIGSIEWFNDLVILGMTPNKSKRMKLPFIPTAYRADFIRGYFDGDGNVWVGDTHKDRQKITRTIQVAFTSASHEFLISLRSLLREIGLTGGGIYINKSATYARLSFSVKDALKIYKIMYNAVHKLLLKRKRRVFEKYFNCGGSSTG